MNQIAIGDTSLFTVIEGSGVGYPYRNATAFFTFSAEPTVRERIELQLSGTPAQIGSVLGDLETIRQRSIAYQKAEFARPQMLRFQPVPSGSYYYAQISDLSFEAHPKSYITRKRGSYNITLHYTRPNYFDGDQVELALTSGSGTDVTGGIDMINHTDAIGTPTSTALIKAATALTDLPAPLRLEIEHNYAGGTIEDVYLGIFHHPTITDPSLLFANASAFTGGTNTANAAAIGGYYRTRTWTSANWYAMHNLGMSVSTVNNLDGRTYRPILHLYASHAYTDLYMRIKLIRGAQVLKTCEPVFCDPNYRYVIFPPIQIPPNQLLRETTLSHIEIEIYGKKIDGAAATIYMDQLILLPMDYAADYIGFFDMSQNDKLIDDAFRGLSIVRYSAAQQETVAHLRVGSPLLLYPDENTHIVTVLANTSHIIAKDQTFKLRAYYRPRVSVL